MITLQERPFEPASNETLRYGIASWSKPTEPQYSVKYAWRDSRGHVCRGGEVPVSAIAPMLAMVIDFGHASPDNVSPADARKIIEWLCRRAGVAVITT